MIEHVEHEKLRVEAGQDQWKDHTVCFLVATAEKRKDESYSEVYNLDMTKSFAATQEPTYETTPKTAKSTKSTCYFLRKKE